MKRLVFLVLATASLCQIAEARQPGRSYRGFFEWSNSLRCGNLGYLDFSSNIYMERESTYYTGFTGSLFGCDTACRKEAITAMDVAV